MRDYAGFRRRCAVARARADKWGRGGKARGTRARWLWRDEQKFSDVTYPVACCRPRKPSATRSFCMASTSRPVAPSYKSRTLPRFPPLGAYERPLEEGAHVLGVLLGPAAARTGRAARREPTNARRCNGAMPDFNDTFGSLCLNALLAPVKAGGVESDAIRAGKCPSQLAFLVLARFCTERRACLPLLRAGLTAAQGADAVQKNEKKRKTNNSIFLRRVQIGPVGLLVFSQRG